jgi:molybdopterin converting factor small subunit
MSKSLKTIHVQYYALLREQRKISSEKVLTEAVTAKEFYQELQTKYHFTLSMDILKVALNDQFSTWNTKLKNNDTIIFIPPVAGG